MEKYVLIGKIVDTHGIKGEVRILSDFELKDKVFIPGNDLYIGNEKIKEKIVTYRHHKEYDMVTFSGYNNINEVLKYKKSLVYFLRDDLLLKDYEYLIDDLINFEVKENDVLLGIIKEISYNNSNILLCVTGKNNFYIPYNGNYIKKVDVNNKIVITENAKDLIL